MRFYRVSWGPLAVVGVRWVSWGSVGCRRGPLGVVGGLLGVMGIRWVSWAVRRGLVGGHGVL